MAGRKAVLLAVVVVFVAGCQHRSMSTGESSFAVVRPPPARQPAVAGDIVASEEDQSVDFRDAQVIRPLVMPIYPPAALAAKTGRVQIGVHVVVDSNGKVSDVAPSLFVLSTPGRFAAAFREAVDTAVRQWRFRPAEIIHLEHAEAKGLSYKRVVRTEKTEAEFDLAFTFTETGKVETGK